MQIQTIPFSGIFANPAFKNIFTNAIDSLLTNNALTVPCQLIFQNTTFNSCPNCLYDTMSGKSTSIYKTGGPIVFNKGICPYCHGLGNIAADNTQTVNLMVIWDYKQWIGWHGVPELTMTPFGHAQTLCSVSLLPAIKAAKNIILDTDVQAYVKHLFLRVSEPNPIGFGKDSYIATMWKREG